MMRRKIDLVGWLGLALLVAGTVYGLTVAPAERHMGDVGRILYVHVPTAWTSMVCFFVAFVLAVATLWSNNDRFDAYTVGAVEVGLVLNGLLLFQGSMWARPTWGIWWTWGDVRLVFSFIMLLLFAGVLALRSFVDDSGRRRNWTAIATIVAFVDVPLVYFCVRWWRTLHQIQSTPETMVATMKLPMRLNAFGMLFLAAWLISRRADLERGRAALDETPAPPRVEPAGGHA